MNKFKNIAITGFSLLCVGVASAQEKTDNGVNPNSVRPIHESNVLWKRTYWRRMDLNEKQNQPFFARNSEITKFLLEGVKAGLLDAYANDSLTRKLTIEQFHQNLLMENTEGGLSEEEKKAGFNDAGAGTDDGWGGTTVAKKDAGATTTPAPVGKSDIEYFAQDFNILEIKEDAIFDKQRSRIYFDIQALTIILPAAKTTKGFDVTVASFKYKDLDKYFRSNPKCVWYNEENAAQHKNMADAFDLRMFYARIIKEGNPKDQYLSDKFGGEKEGLFKSQQLEYKLMEFEHNLWEY